MFETFTESAIKVIMLAQEECRRLDHNRCGSEQILLGLIGADGIARQSLKKFGLSYRELRVPVEKLIGKRNDFSILQQMFAWNHRIPFSNNAKSILEFAQKEAQEGKDENCISTGHLLIGVLNLKEAKAISVLDSYSLNCKEIDKHTRELMITRDDN